MFFSEPKAFAIIMALAASVLRLFGSIDTLTHRFLQLVQRRSQSQRVTGQDVTVLVGVTSRVRLIAI